MSLSYDMVKHIADDVRAMAQEIEGTAVALETNKRIVICCLTQYAAWHLGAQLKVNRMDHEIKKGKETDRVYVQVYY